MVLKTTVQKQSSKVQFEKVIISEFHAELWTVIPKWLSIPFPIRSLIQLVGSLQQGNGNGIPIPVPILDLKVTMQQLERQGWNGENYLKTKTNMAGASTNKTLLLDVYCSKTMTPSFFYSMTPICVQICIYYIGNMTAFH